MRKKTALRLGFFLFLFTISCAIITVNIYFPEKDVKEAYKALEKELMTPEQKPEGKPEEKTGEPPQSFRSFEFVSTVYAQSELSERIAEIVKKMPEVVNAYREMGARLPEIDRLRDKGVAGEGKEGLLVIRDEKGITPSDRKLITDENENRKTVMKGMARAIIRINRVPENDQNLRQVTPQAIEQFAAIRRSSAKKGWWVQDPYGNWTKK